MRRIKLILLVFFFYLISFSPNLFASVYDFHDELTSITDPHLRKTLSNSIVAGLIKTTEDFDAVVSKYENSVNKNGLALITPRSTERFDIAAVRTEIKKLSELIHDLDQDYLIANKTPDYRKENYLFENLQQSLPKSYNATYKMCKYFNPLAGHYEAPKLDKEINEYLSAITADPIIKYALNSTNTTIDDLKRNWFGVGLGFQHVFAGELKGTQVGGYHWWYTFYQDERAGFAEPIKATTDIGNPNVFTGSFHWDPDGPGPLPTGYKKIGGFIIGNSAQTILALGHIAIETSRKHGKIPASLSFRADINGEEFSWQLYTVSGTIRTLYPIGNSSVLIIPTNEDDEYLFNQSN